MVVKEGAFDITAMYDVYKLNPTVSNAKMLLDAVNDNNGVVYIDKNEEDEFKQFVDAHNTYNSEDEYRFQESLKNKIFTEIWSVGTNFTNFVSETTPISMKEGQEAAEKAESFSKYINNSNPFAKAIAQYQNSIGKDAIGIAATGIKIYSNILSFTHSKLYAKSKYTESEWNQVIQDISNKTSNITGLENNILSIIPNVNYENLRNVYIVDNEGNIVLGEDGKPLSVLDQKILRYGLTLRELLKKQGPQEDVFLALSVLLSLATDNAKELILEKINATPDLMGMYVYLLFRGISFSACCDFMNNKAMNLIKEKSKSNIFSSHDANNSVDTAIRYFNYGPDIKDFIDESYVESVKAAWTSYLKEYNINTNDNKKLGNLNTAIVQPEFPSLIPNFKEYLKKFVISKNYAVYDPDDIDFTNDEDTVIISAGDNIKILINRFLNECNHRFQLLESWDSYSDAMIEFANIKSIRSAAKELTLLGRLSSLNQGIKTQLYEQDNFLYNIDKEVRKILKLTPDEIIAIESILGLNKVTPNDVQNGIIDSLRSEFSLAELDTIYRLTKNNFDLNEFVNDSDIQTSFIKLYNYKRSFVNILKVITSTPHFKEMLKAFTVNNDVLDKLTFRHKEISKIARRLRFEGITKNSLTKSEMDKVDKFLTDCIVNNYLNKLTVTLPDVKQVFVNDKFFDNNSSIELDLSKIDDRVTLKNWMESLLLNYAATKNDNFANNITVKSVLNELRTPYLMCALNIDMSSLSKDVNESRLSDIMVDYNSRYANITMDNTKINDNSDVHFEDLLFIYNLIVNKGTNSKYAFTNLFKDSLNNKKSLAYDYIARYIGRVSIGEEVVNYDTNDLIARLLSIDGNTDKISKKRNANGEIEILYQGTRINKRVNPIANIDTLILTNNGDNILTVSKAIQLSNDIIKLIIQGNAEFKLNCD